MKCISFAERSKRFFSGATLILLAAVLPGLAWGQIPVSIAQEPTAPAGFKSSLQPYGFYIATGYAAAACGFRPTDWAQTLFQRIGSSVVVQLKNLNATDKQKNDVLDYFYSEMQFGQGFTGYGCSLLASAGLGPLDAIEAGMLPP